MSRNKPPRDSAPKVEPLSSDATHEVAFFKRHHDDDAAQAAPGLDALRGFPTNVRATPRGPRRSGQGTTEAVRIDF